MLFASLIAGMVINRTGTIIVHGMGYVLTLDYNIPHGLANTLLLPYAIKYLSKIYREKLKILKKIFGDDIWEITKDLNKKVGIPRNLEAAGVKEGDIEKLSQRGINDCVRSLKNIPMKLTREDFYKIYKNAFYGRY